MKNSILTSAYRVFACSLLAVICFELTLPPFVFANPQGGTVVAGSAAIQQESAAKLNIHQQTEKAIINWQDFSIQANEHTQFFQPSAASFTLNRVTGGNPSEIMGRLSANGGIMLINQNGILFGPHSQIDVAALVASTHDIQNEDFMAGRYHFDLTGHPSASVINQGNISIADMGLAAFVAPSVQNSGVIVAKLGKVALASANGFTLDMYGDDLINLLVDDRVAEAALDQNGNPLKSLVGNDGKISADGGYVVLSANAARAVVDNVINISGIIEARSFTEKKGEIVLSGGDNGITSVSGLLDASGRGTNETGGTVKILGDKVGLFEQAEVNVSGTKGGGTVLIGGNYQGQGPEQNASGSYVSHEAIIRADALERGNGGKVITWADETARFYGNISATGGAIGGDGGFVEVSGGFLDYQGFADLSAANGGQGSLLLDPNNITIQAAGVDTDINGASPFVSSDDNAILLTSTIESALNSGDVSIFTALFGGNSQDGDIIVNDTITGPANNSNLTLKAYDDIIVNADIDMSSGTGQVVMQADFNNNGVGTFTMAGGTTLTASGSMFIYANDIDLQGNLNSTSQIDLCRSKAGTIGLGNAAGDMTISGGELGRITTENLFIDHGWPESNTSNIIVDGIIAANTANINTLNLYATSGTNGQVTFDNSASDFGNVGLSVFANNGISVNQDVSANTVSMYADGDNSGTGTFTVANGMSLTSHSSGGRVMAITAHDLDLQGSLNSGTEGAIWLSRSTVGTIGLGNAVGDMTISGVELGRIITGNLGIGGWFSGNNVSNIIVDGISAANTANINILSISASSGTNAQVEFDNGASDFGNAHLYVYANNGISVNQDVFSANPVYMDADADYSGTGTFTVASGMSLTSINSAGVNIGAHDLDLQGSLNNGMGCTWLYRSTAGTIGLGNTNADMTINGGELGRIITGELIIGKVLPDNNVSNIIVDGIIAANTANIISGVRLLASSGTNGQATFDNSDSDFGNVGLYVFADNGISVNQDVSAGIVLMNADLDNNRTGTFSLAPSTTLTSRANSVTIVAADTDIRGTIVGNLGLFSTTPPSPAPSPDPAPAPVISPYEDAASGDLFDAIKNGDLVPDPDNPAWTALYENGKATQAQKDAYAMWQSYNTYHESDANSLFEAIKNGTLKSGSDELSWTALYENGKATQVQKNAYAMWQSYNTYHESDANSLFESIKNGTLKPGSAELSWTALYENGNPTQAQRDAYTMWQDYLNPPHATDLPSSSSPNTGSSIPPAIEQQVQTEEKRVTSIAPSIEAAVPDTSTPLPFIGPQVPTDPLDDPNSSKPGIVNVDPGKGISVYWPATEPLIENIFGQADLKITKNLNQGTVNTAAIMSKLAYEFDENQSSQTWAEMLNNWLTAHNYELELAYNLNSIQFFVASQTDSNGKKTYAISIRGTDEKTGFMAGKDWDFNYSDDPYKGNVGRSIDIVAQDCKIHAGYGIIAQTVLDNLPPEIMGSIKSGNAGLMITGHSLGGAAATLLSAGMLEAGVSPEDMHTYTFGAPPVGNDQFVNKYGSKLNLDRIVNPYDPVPNTGILMDVNPVQIGEVHVSADLSSLHSMDSYLENTNNIAELDNFRDAVNRNINIENILYNPVQDAIFSYTVFAGILKSSSKMKLEMFDGSFMGVDVFQKSYTKTIDRVTKEGMSDITNVSNIGNTIAKTIFIETLKDLATTSIEKEYGYDAKREVLTDYLMDQLEIIGNTAWTYGKTGSAAAATAEAFIGETMLTVQQINESFKAVNESMEIWQEASRGIGNIANQILSVEKKAEGLEKSDPEKADTFWKIADNSFDALKNGIVVPKEYPLLGKIATAIMQAKRCSENPERYPGNPQSYISIAKELAGQGDAERGLWDKTFGGSTESYSVLMSELMIQIL